ncbi:hypothetical protein HOD75_01760 [archaeon]|jgi:hypothetical protein|nr:hypothetical protein [archaeon]MBT4241603.1 hypothetical protein [archaeon]MBT4417998.1 hypothetical protein [archaeon]
MLTSKTPTSLARTQAYKIQLYEPSANLLQGQLAEEVFKEYVRRVAKDFSENPELKGLTYNPETQTIKGSNSYSAILINQIVEEKGLRVATQADLERILFHDPSDLRGFYNDAALILRSTDEPNKYPAKYLAEQIKTRTKLLPHYPLMINLTDLELEKKSKRILFKLKENAEPIRNPVLNQGGTFSPDEIDFKTGLPTSLPNYDTDENGLPIPTTKDGIRLLAYTRDKGLTRMTNNIFTDLETDILDLSRTEDTGRIIVIDPNQYQ